jgi:pyrrolidone-carboxylate peptidase
MTIFAFKGTVAEKVSRGLNFPDTYIIEGNKVAIAEFVDHLKAVNPDKILGLGSYSGRDQDQIRIETQCSNKFGNNILGGKLEILPIRYWIQASADFKLAHGIGNSYCNLMSFLITKNLDCEYTFLHIPATIDVLLTANKIRDRINFSLELVYR